MFWRAPQHPRAYQAHVGLCASVPAESTWIMAWRPTPRARLSQKLPCGHRRMQSRDVAQLILETAAGHPYLRLYMCAHIHIHVQVQIYRCIYMCIYIRIYIRIHLYIYIYTYMRTYRHTYIHTYIQTDRQTDRQTYIYMCPIPLGHI